MTAATHHRRLDLKSNRKRVAKERRPAPFPDFMPELEASPLREARLVIEGAKRRLRGEQDCDRYDHAIVLALRDQLSPEELIRAATLAMIERLNWVVQWFLLVDFKLQNVKLGDRPIIGNPASRALDEAGTIIDACERELTADSPVVSNGGLCEINPHRLAWAACHILHASLDGIPLHLESQSPDGFTLKAVRAMRPGAPLAPLISKLRQRFDWARLRAMVVNWETQTIRRLRRHGRPAEIDYNALAAFNDARKSEGLTLEERKNLWNEQFIPKFSSKDAYRQAVSRTNANK